MLPTPKPLKIVFPKSTVLTLNVTDFSTPGRAGGPARKFVIGEANRCGERPRRQGKANETTFGRAGKIIRNVRPIRDTETGNRRRRWSVRECVGRSPAGRRERKSRRAKTDSAEIAAVEIQLGVNRTGNE